MNFCVTILTLKMEGKKWHFWHTILYDFKKGKNATETQNKISAVYGEGAVTDWTCHKWFAVSCWKFSLDHAPRSGRPVEVDSNQIKKLIENNQCETEETDDMLKISKSIKSLVKMKNVSYFTNKLNKLFGHPVPTSYDPCEDQESKVHKTSKLWHIVSITSI